jgi:hypothetical protein
MVKHPSGDCELGVEASVDESSDLEGGSTKARTVEPHTETVWDIESHVKSGLAEEEVMKEFGRQKNPPISKRRDKKVSEKESEAQARNTKF